MRKLASIRTITDIQPIEGKDRIELALVDGWSVIIKKGEYNIGDRTIFCEPDSVLPDKPEFEFLKSKGFRIKTMKMSGVISQGICFPLSLIPSKDYNIGEDVTELLGITQYEFTMDKEIQNNVNENKKYTNPIFTKFLFKFKFFRDLLLPKNQNKGFPSFVSKTDETRIQNAPFYLTMNCEWIETEKIDGQSGTFSLERIKPKYFWQKEKFDFSVCSRNLRRWEIDNSSYWTVAKKYNIENVLKELIGNNDWISLQGECVASDVQGNKYKVKEPDLYAFNLIFPNGRMGSIEAKELLDKHGVKFVPIIKDNISLNKMSVKEILEYVTGNSKLYPTLREGSVFRSLDGKLSFKAVSPSFLIKNNE